MQEKLRFLGLDVHAGPLLLLPGSRMVKCEAWARFRTARNRSAS
jgi:hypothetical protein